MFQMLTLKVIQAKKKSIKVCKMKLRKSKYVDSYNSLYEKLRSEEKINEEFMFMLSNITFEELIGLKLESMIRILSCRFNGLPLIDSIENIVESALVNIAYSYCTTKRDSSYLLGITPERFEKLIKKHNSEDYFKKERNRIAGK